MKNISSKVLKLCTLSSIALSFTLVSYGQYSLELSKAYGGTLEEYGTAVAISDDTNFAVGGYSKSSDIWLPGNKGGSDYWIMQFNADGDTLWSRTYGGFNNDDLYALTYNASGGIAAFGTTRSNDGDVLNNPSVIGAWLLTLDIAGNPIISRVYAGDLGEQGVDILGLSNGYALLVQSTSPELEGAQNNGNFDVWIARTNNIGSVDWAEFLGGSDADIPAAMARTPGGIVIAASSNSIDGDVVGNNGGFDYWIVSVNLEGELEWAWSYGGSDDDHASDVAVADDGSIYVIGESASSDGDKTQSLGENDVWILKLDEDGNLLWERSFGGSDDDAGTQIGVLSNGLIVASANSESDDFDLDANKGLTDGWVIFLDDNGNLVQQMNYGGSEIDETAGLAVDQDDRVWITGSTNSRNQNLSFGDPPFINLWLMEIEQDTANCVPNEDCNQDNLGQGVINVATNGGTTCTQSCNVGLSTGPSGSGCYGFSTPSTWFKVRTDSIARQMTITVTSDEFNTPQISVMQTLNCIGLNRLQCTIGSDGVAAIYNISVDPDTAYYVTVGDANGLTGDFQICITVLDIEFCNTSPLLYPTTTSMGSPLEGPYQPGEEVQFCYEIPAWNKIDCNGLQGIQPTWGPGWDSMSFNIFDKPNQIDTFLTPIANGTWEWYPLASVNYNFTNPFQGYQGGQGLPPGWYFTNLDDPPPTDGPDDTTGDIVTCLDDTSTWKVCFTLQTVENCTTDMNCSISIKSFADGEIGSFVSQACQYDEPTVFEATMKCCLNPFINPVSDKTLCSGDTVTVFFDSNLEPPVTYSWEVETFGNVVGAEDGSGPFLQQQVFNFDSDISSVIYTVNAVSAGGCETEETDFQVILRPFPLGTMTLFSEDTTCAGDDVTLRFSFQGTPPYFATFAVNGIPQPEFVAEETPAFATIQLDETAQLTFIEYNDVFCDGNTTGTFTVHVEDHSSLDTLTTICPGDSVEIGGQYFRFPGNYEVTLEGAAANGCDSTIFLELEGLNNREAFLEVQICVGDTFSVGDSDYTTSGIYEDVLVASNGCDSLVTLALNVTNTIISSQNRVICFGDTVEFRGRELTQSGVYRDTVPQSVTCDSIYMLSLTVLNNIILTNTVIEPDTGDNSGSIMIQVTGGFPPYSYFWSTGDTTQNLDSIATGDYSVTVTDVVGCQGVFDFFISTAVKAPLTGIDNIRIHPNPVAVQSSVEVSFFNSRASRRTMHVTLMDVRGKVLQRTEIPVVNGQNRLSLPLTSVAPGLHYVLLEDRNENTYQAFPLIIQ